MANIRVFNGDNKDILDSMYKDDYRFDVCYADCIYESLEFGWVDLVYKILKTNGLLYLQTDDHTIAEWKVYLDKLFGKQNHLNTLITIQEWGGTSKRFFPRKHDYILFYCKGKDYKFYPERIQIPKVTAGTNFDKKRTGLKTPCDVFYDLGNFSTTSKERIKGMDGKNIKWQKPQKLYERILKVCTDEGDSIIDPFMGSGSLANYCKSHKLNYVGIEIDSDIFNIAKERIELI